jgi:hypothetical protein
MVFVLLVAAAVVLGLGLGGRLAAVAELKVHGLSLFYAAIVLQIVAFPASFLPWATGEEAGRWIWLASYACVLCGAALNLHLRGVALTASGILLNLTAIIANGGSMPALPRAVHGAGMSAGVHHNSITTAEPRLAWFVDRWSAPDWLPLANVFSVGDVVLAVGAVVLVLAALQVPALRRLPQPRVALR